MLRKNQNDTFWSGHIERWRSSGISQRKYCLRERISYWAFRDRLKKPHDMNIPERKPVPVPWQVYQGGISDDNLMRISIGSEIRIDIHRGCDENSLRTVLQEIGTNR